MRTRGENLISISDETHETRKRLNEIEKEKTLRDFYYCYFLFSCFHVIIPVHIYISSFSLCCFFCLFKLSICSDTMEREKKKGGGKHFDITFLFRPHRQRCRILLVRSIANRLLDFLYIFPALLCSSSSPFPPLHLPRLRSDARTGGMWIVSVRIKPPPPYYLADCHEPAMASLSHFFSSLPLLVESRFK